MSREMTPNHQALNQHNHQGLLNILRMGSELQRSKYPMRWSMNGCDSDIMWSGNAWTCGKQLKHYRAFCRNGTTIAIQSFVFVMAKGENHYVAYLEDMYEDKRGQKKVKVRWFHHGQEVKGVVSLRNPHPKEIYITSHAQVISAECVDGPAIVLTREHFEKCVAAFPNALLARIHFCTRQFRSNRLKPFDLSKLHGYYEQPLISLLNSSPFRETDMEEGELPPGENLKLGTKRTRHVRGSKMADSLRVESGRGYNLMRYEPSFKNLKYGLSGISLVSLKQIEYQPWTSPLYEVDEKIELLCQDSGIRGCWFRCVILQVSRKQIKVQYDDLLDEDGYGNLEEWVPLYKVAIHDKLGMRCSDRPTIRPAPPNVQADLSLDIGAAVDAWWSDGWWEGVVTGFDSGSNDNLQVYLPGESFFLNMHKKDIRISKDWVRNQWVDIEAKPDILTAISAVLNPDNKVSVSSTVAKDVKPGCLDMSYTDVPSSTKLDITEGEKPKLDTLASCDNLKEEDMDRFNEEKPASQEVNREGGDDVNVSSDEVHGVQCIDAKDIDETKDDNDDNRSKSDAEDLETSECNHKTAELVDVPA
ncbi:uncharacterized protein LOC123226107 isoform X2 [Mangifera indica]|uniref:uncharacterized protein LOC123226107 isoform X2 n=1 Tax=Mangifera indica TaxID=29780 RepID=UPI001CF9CC99|nr:uncharacterized protein LOC123226107 isoform X2 [Mangifera indica]